MKWSDVAEPVAKIAPLLGSVLAGSAGQAAGTLVAHAMGVDPSPEGLAGATTDPEKVAVLKEVEFKHKERLIELQLTATSQDAAEQTKRLVAINQTMQAELDSDDFFKSAWRSTLGWIYGFGTLFSYVIIGYTIVALPESRSSALDMIWAVLAINAGSLGISHKVIGDIRKTKITGHAPPTLYDSVKARLPKRQ